MKAHFCAEVMSIMNDHRMRDWFRGLWYWIVESLHDLRTDICRRRDERHGKPWSLPMREGKE